ncbi:hypothetical protein, partial [Wocania ichthyoenteri]|uniref:hypothetical protein n=1 Tax=Wocania ichthyoenteri TaxID=1230531 RepID=UPI00194DC4FC
MESKTLFRYAKSFVAFIMLFLWSVFSLHAQCPSITQPPTPISDASGLTFLDLDAIASAGSDVIWYNAATGGTPYNDNQLVYEGTYYAGDSSGTCGVRQALIVDFEVNDSGENLDRFFCSNDNPTFQDYIDQVLQPSIPSGGDVEIYLDFELTTIVNAIDPILSGPADYYIIFINSSGDRSQIEIGSIAVIAAPANPTPTDSQEFCSDTNPTIADLNPGTIATNYSWYNNIDGSGNTIPPALSAGTALVDGNTYYIEIQGFCKSEPVPVTVIISTPVDAGTASPAEFCEDDLITNSPLDLFGQLTGEDAGGTWTDDNTTGALTGSDVNLTILPLGTSVFTYTVLSNNACPDATSAVSITVYETLSSGTPSALNPASFCEANLPASFDLFTLIENYDPNGQWTQGTTSTDPVVTSPIDLTGFTPATYNFTYTQNVSPNPCPEESTTVQVIVLQDPNAGIQVIPAIEFCENDLAANSPFDLFDALTAPYDSGGTWTDSSSATVSNNIDITGFTITGSPYEYTYTVDNGTCTDDETISITILPAPESGTANPPAEFCEDAAPANFDLFTLLEGEDQTGTWNDDDASGALTGNTVDLSGLTPATYNFTFDVDAIGSCDDVLVTVSVTINPLPNTGTPMAATFCENNLVANSPLDLLGQLTGEDAGGTWTDDNTSGALSGSDVDLTLLTIGSYNFTYSITDANGCSNSSTVTVIVEDAPESGTANTPAEYCEGSAPANFDLFTLLEGEDQTGTWNDDDASGALTGNTVDLSGLTPATYNFTFDVDAIGSCDDVLVTV